MNGLGPALDVSLLSGSRKQRFKRGIRGYRIIMKKYPVVTVDRIKQIKYRAIVELKDGEEHMFSLSEMEKISQMWSQFKITTQFTKI